MNVARCLCVPQWFCSCLLAALACARFATAAETVVDDAFRRWAILGTADVRENGLADLVFATPTHSGVDFFSVKTVTTRGIRDMYVLVWLCMTTREVIVSESLHPNSAWVAKQADWFVDETASREEKPNIVMHSKDSKFSKEFTDKLKARGVRTNSLPKASPNLNGRCERFVGTIKWECLSGFIIFGKAHLDHLVAEFVDYYNTTRSSMVRDHLPPIREEPDEVTSLKLDQVEVKSHVGALVKSFARKAA